MIMLDKIFLSFSPMDSFSIYKYIVKNDLGREICMTSQAKDEQCGIAVEMR